MIELISKIRKAQEVIARDIPNENPKFRPGHEMAKREASGSIEKLNKELVEKLATVAVPVYVTGEKATELADAMKTLAPAAVIDLNDIYKTVVDAVRPSIGRSNEFGVSQFVILVRMLRDMASENGVPSLGVPKFREPIAITSEEALKRIVLRYADESIGSELAINYIRKQTAEQAVKVVDEKVPVFPVFIVNCEADHRDALTKRLFKNNREIVIEAPSEITEKVALSSLGSIKKSLKASKE